MKPRILINMHYMALGGAERALLGLLNAFDTTRVEVDLFLNQHTGEFLPFIPNKINLLSEKKGYNAIERPMKEILKEGQFRVLFGRLMGKWNHRQYYNKLTKQEKSFDSCADQYVANSVNPFLPSLSYLGEYDLAISFLPPHNIVLNKFDSKKKIAWIHTDYSTIHINTNLELPIWSGYDKIISISHDCSKGFLKKFPALENKIMEMENILSSSFINSEANNGQAFELNDYNGIKLLSIGRYDHAKNYDNVPYIFKKVLKQIPNAKWFIIGYGGSKELIKQKIEDAGMQDHIILLGKKTNPYPFIKACDFYVQPSRYEGKSVTVREAQVLCKPVIITNYATAKSQIKNGIDGIITPMDNDGCAQGIIDAINNPQLIQSIVGYLQTHDYGNESEIEKIYNLL